MAGPLAHQLLAGAQQAALFLRRGIGDETAADQAMRQQIGQPSCVVHVGLAAGHVLDMRRIGQGQRKIAVAEDVPDRLPVDPGRLHHDVGAALGSQPLRQRQQLGGRRLERADLAPDDAVRHMPHAGHHRILMHVEAGAVGVKNFHVAPPGAPPAWDVRQKNSRKRAPEPLPARGTIRGAQTSRIQLNKGLVRTKETSISPPATRTHHTPAVPPFHAQRVGNAGGELNGGPSLWNCRGATLNWR